ncbi:27861_t:CDS:1, partial [Dentiscutata erythropus]
SLSDILDNVTRELAESVSINLPERLQHTNRFQYDLSIPQYIIQSKVLPTKDSGQASVSQIINY